MTSKKPVGYDEFPKQFHMLGKKVEVMFSKDSSRIITGTVVRDDDGPPHLTIIKLKDGRHIMGTECQWRPKL